MAGGGCDINACGVLILRIVLGSQDGLSVTARRTLKQTVANFALGNGLDERQSDLLPLRLGMACPFERAALIAAVDPERWRSYHGYRQRFGQRVGRAAWGLAIAFCLGFCIAPRTRWSSTWGEDRLRLPKPNAGSALVIRSISFVVRLTMRRQTARTGRLGLRELRFLTVAKRPPPRVG